MGRPASRTNSGWAAARTRVSLLLPRRRGSPVPCAVRLKGSPVEELGLLAPASRSLLLGLFVARVS
jgi:hypothetical protein